MKRNTLYNKRRQFKLIGHTLRMNWLNENALLEEDRRDDRRGGRRGKQLLDELKETKKTTGTRKSRHSIELCGEIILQEAMDLSQGLLRYEHAIYKGCCWPHSPT